MAATREEGIVEIVISDDGEISYHSGSGEEISFIPGLAKRAGLNHTLQTSGGVF